MFTERTVTMETKQTTSRGDHFTVTANILAIWKQKQEYKNPACSYFEQAKKRQCTETQFSKTSEQMRLPKQSRKHQKTTRRERLKSALYLRLKKRNVCKIVKDGFFLEIQFASKYQNC